MSNSCALGVNPVLIEANLDSFIIQSMCLLVQVSA